VPENSRVPQVASLNELSLVCHRYGGLLSTECRRPVLDLSLGCHWFVIRLHGLFPVNAKRRRIVREAI
jgi:hypothetical protein